MNAPVLVAQLSGSAPQAPATPKNLKLEKPQNGQAVTIHLDGNTKLDLSDIASEKLTFVRVGEKLIVLFDNQSTVTVDPVFDSSGHPLADVAFDLGQNRAVTGDEFASLFPITTDQSVLPAAGGNSGPTGGANFSDAHVNALTDPNAPLALLGDENNGSPFGSLAQESGSAPVAGVPFANAGLSESNLSGGTAENAGLTTSTGFLGVNFGTAASSAVLSFDENQSGLATLRSEGELVNFARVADAAGHFTQLIGFVGADPNIVANRVFIATLDPTVEGGGYTVTLLRPLDHGSAGADTLNFALNVTASNQFGSDATEIHVNVQDDVLVLNGDVAAQNVNEDGLADANGFVAGAGSVGPVALNIDWGADNDTRGNSAGDTFGRTLSFVADGVPAITGANGEGLSSGGVTLEYVVTPLADGGQLLTAYKGAPGENNAVFTLTLDPTSEHGAYSFNLLGTLDHAAGSDSIGLTFAVQAADADGDTANLNFTVNVADDLPGLAGAVAAHNVTEDGLTAANDFVAGGGSTGSVDLNINWGADNDLRGTAEGDAFGRTLSFVADGIPAISGANGAALSSGGVALQYVVTTLADGGQLLTAFKGDARGDEARVFTLTLDPASEHGAYSFNLLGTLDHATGSNSIGMTFTVQAAEADGDTVNTSFVVNVADDTPVLASAVAAHGVTEDGLAGANGFVSGAGSTGAIELNINWGADSDTRGNGAGDTFGRTLSFLSGSGSEGDPTLTPLTGSDQPVAYLAFAVSGENGALLSSGGVALQYIVTTLADGGQLLTAYKGDARADDARVFTLTLDPTSEHGAYSFNLLGTLDHATGSDSIGLTFGVQAADADGDTIDTSFVVNVADDLPVIIAPEAGNTGAVDEDGGLAGGNATGPGEVDATMVAVGDLGIHWGTDATDAATDINGLQDGAHINSESSPTALTGRAVYFTDAAVTVGFDLSGEGGQSSPTLTSNGQTVLFRLGNDGTTLEGYVHSEGQESGGDRTVFTVSLSDDGSGAYTFTLLGTLDHPVSGTEDNIALTFNYTARDFDGDTASATFTVSVNDDSPSIGNPIAAQYVDEEGVNGNAGDSYPQGDFGSAGDVAGAATTAGGSLNIMWGADAGNSHPNGGFSGAQINGDRSVVFSGDVVGNLQLLGLTSDGVGLQYELSSDGTTLTAFKGGTHTSATEVFQVILSDNSSGSYAFNLTGNLDHPGTNIEDNLTLTFGFTARDGDGDAVSSTFQVIVNDDAPLAGQATSGLVDEDGGFLTGIPGGDGDVAAGIVASGSLGVTWGADNDLKSETLANGTIGAMDDPIGRTVSFAAADGGTALGGTAQFVSGSLVIPDITVTDTAFGQTTNVSAALTSDGVGLSYRLSYHTDSSGHWDGGYVLLAYKSGGDANRASDQVFKVTIDPTSEHGSYKFELLGNLDHPAAGTEDNLNLTFHLVAADADGDQIHTDFTVAVNDDSPITVLNIPDGSVEEEQFVPSGNEDTDGAGDHDLGSQGIGAAVTTGHVDGLLNIVWGADSGNSNVNGGFTGNQINGDRSVVFATGEGHAATLSGDEVRAFLSVTDGNLTLDPATMTSRGVALQYVLSADGTTLTAFAGDPDIAHKVFEVKLSDQGLLGTGSYSFDLLDVLDHPVKGNSLSQEDALSFKFTFTARDGDGDSVSDHFTVNVSDDSPTIGKPESLSVSESTSSAAANTFVPAEANGSLGIHWGADDNNSGAVDRSVAFTDATLDALADLNLRSNGTKITYSLSADDTLLTAKAGSVTVFTVQLSDVSDNGSYTFKLMDNIDHRGNGASVQDLTFGFFATDSDGDTTTPANFTVSIADDVPVAGIGDDATISEKFLLSGTDPHVFDLTVGGKLNIDWNSDDHNSGASANRSVSFAHAIAADNVKVTDANGQPVATALTSDGYAVNYAMVGGILYGYTTSLLNPVFLVTLSDSGTGNYTFTLLGNLDHGTGAANYELNLTFSYTATDSDGDPSSNVFMVTVLDDAPLAGVGDHRTANENDLSDGTSPDTPVRVHGGLNIDWGADHNNPTSQGGAHDRSVTFTDNVNAAANVTAGLTSNGAQILYTLIGGVLVGYTGALPHSATDSNVVFNVSLSDGGDGSYTFTLLGNLDHPAGASTNTLDLTFNYTATDSDGDSSPNTFTVTVVDDVPLGGQVISNSTAVDEAALLTSSSGDNQISGDLNDGIAANGEVIFGADGYKAGSLAINQTGVTVFDSNGNVETGFVLKSEGQDVKFVSDGTTLYGYIGPHTASYVASHPGVQVFKLVLDPATGGYTFTLLAPLDHTGAANNTDLILGFGLKALDGDSDPVTFTLKLDVTDTVPTVAGGDASSVSESNTRDGTDPLFFGLVDPSSNGVLHVNWGADDNNSSSANRSVAFAGYTAGQSATDAGIGSLTSNGQEIHIRVVGTTLYGYTGTAPSNPNAAPSSSQQVFKVELSDSGAGSYKFTLLGNLDHPTPPSGTANDANTLTLHFNYTATDADGDTSAPASFDVTVIDDELQLRGADHGYVAEGALTGGNGVGIIAGFLGLGQSASGSLGIRWGADHNDPDSGAHDRSVRFDPSLDHANASFTSHGEQVTYSLSPDGLTLTAATASHQPVFTVTLSDNGQGGYTFTLQGPIDHGAGGLADFLGDLSFGFVATDSDGDSKTGSFQVTVIDDVPVAPGVTITGTLVHDESAGTQSAPADDVSIKPAVFDGVNALSGLSAIGYASDAVVTVTPHDGADGHLSTTLALTNGLSGQFNGAATNLFDTATGHRIFLYSDASGVVFGRVGSGDGLFAASSGGAIAFAIGIDNSQNATGNSGVLSVAEYRAISHSGTTDANDSVSLKSGLLGGDLLYVTASTTDFDHDNSILTTTRPLTVSFLDDGPSALGVAQDMPENTPVSIVLTEGVNYAFGADGEGKPVTLGDATVTDAPNGFSFDASKLTVNLVENGGHITVDVNPGTAFDALPAGATAVLHIPYTVTDGDGDSISRDIAVTINGTNDLPIARADNPQGDDPNYAMTEDTASRTFDVLSNDTLDPDVGAANNVTIANVYVAGLAGIDSATPLDPQSSGLFHISVTADNKIQVDLVSNAWDKLANGATANIIVGYTLHGDGADTSYAQLAVRVTGVNDAPVLLTGPSPAISAIEDAAAPVGNVGTLVSSLLNEVGGSVGNVADPDGIPTFHPGMVITALDTSHGTWYWSSNSSASWNQVTGLPAGQALYLLPTDAIYFKPSADYNGTIGDAITFHAWDRSNGSFSGLSGEPASYGGTTPYSANTDTVSLTVVPVNDAATISGNAAGEVTEDVSFVASGALTVADADAGEAHFSAPDPASLTQTYGTFTFADGAWTYTLNNSASVVQQLGGGKTVTDTLHVVSVDGSAEQDIVVTINGTNDAPVIDSDQGLDVVALSIPENTTAVTTVHAHDIDSPTITYAIQGGDDANLFQIDAGSGVLTFKNAPDFENKLDANHDNTYQVIVTASDGVAMDSQTINVAVTDVIESVAPPIVVDHDVSSGQYAFWNDAIQPSAISFDASALFGGTALTYTVTQAFPTNDQSWNWFHTSGSTIFSGDPDGNNQRGLYVAEVQAHNAGGTTTTYVAFDVFGKNGSDGSRFDVIDNDHRSVTDQYRDNLVVLKPGVDIPDDVSGGDNHDVVIGNEFANRLFGSNGDDAIYGGGGNDYIDGGDNNDFLSGGAGDDTIYASNGTDFLLGDAGNDYLYGGDNNDVLLGGAGDDHLYGEQGDDVLYGGAGNDVLSGGMNADIFVFEEYGDQNVDTILDYSRSQNDKIDLSSILDGRGVTTSNFDSYVQLDNSGNNVKVQVDVSGQGSNWSDVAILQNYHTAGNQVLIELDHQVQTHTLTVVA